MSESEIRPCTCHPDEAPVPCQRGYAISLCLRRARNDDADELARLRSERSNLLGTVRLHKERAEALTARVEELEGALKDLVRLIDEDEEEDAPPYLLNQVLDRARAAITKGERK